MRSTPSYDNPDSPETKAAAIADIKKFLDEENFYQLSAFLREKAGDRVPDIQNFRAAVGVVGIGGYQAQCWYECLWPNRG